MKKSFLTLIIAISFSTATFAQELFKAGDVEKIADYVINELQLKGADAVNVKNIYADYGQKMNGVMKSMKGLNIKQNEVQALTKEMDDKVKEKIPAGKKSDYDTVVNHYRKKGIGSSALNSGQNTNNSTSDDSSIKDNVQSKLDENKQVAEQLKDGFKNELGVNDAQADQLVRITLEHAIQKKIINQTYKSDAVNRSQKMNELNLKTNQKVKEILNEQQYKKFLMVLIKNGQGL